MLSAGFIWGFRSRLLLMGVAFVAALFSVLLATTQPIRVDAATTLPTKMNFQGRIANSANNVLANGSYNMKFRIYNASSGGTLQWSEDRLVSASQGVTVTNGQFSVQLGEISSLPASIFTSNSLYFEIELPTPATATSSSPSWTEGAMTPRNQLATSAYAYNAETLDGIDGASFAQLGTGNVFTAANSVNAASANAFQVRNGSTNLFNVDTSGSLVTLGASDTTGALLVVDTKTDAGDPTGANGGIYYNSNANKFRCYEASAWKDCVATPSLQTAYNNDASGVADVVTTSSAKTFLFKAGSTFDSSTLFDIQNAAGTSLFTVDSTNSRIYVGSSTADAVGTVLVLDTKNTAGDPTGVNGAMYYNSSLGQFRCYSNTLWRPCSNAVSANTSVPAGNTVGSNSTAEAIFASNYAIPANECRTGKVYRVSARGVYSTYNLTAPSLTLRIKFGSTNVLATGANATTTNMANRQWTISADIVCQTAPSTTATVEGQGTVTRATAAATAVQWEMVSTAGVTVDTTAAQTLQVSAQFGAANAANTITLRQLIVQELSPQ